MKRIRMALFGVGCFAAGILAATSLPKSQAAEDTLDARIFELRTYYTNEGKLEDLHKRFREHTNYLFVKHGMDLVGYWVPTEGEERLVYMIAHEDAAAAKQSWADFVSDPEWKAVYAASRENGPLVEHIENVYMNPTDYSPIR